MRAITEFFHDEPVKIHAGRLFGLLLVMQIVISCAEDGSIRPVTWARTVFAAGWWLVFGAKTLDRMPRITQSAATVLLAAGLVGQLVAISRERPKAAPLLAANDPIAQIAASRISRFHGALEQRQYGDVCANAELGAFAGVTGLPCAQFLDYLATHLGAIHESMPKQFVISGGGSTGSVYVSANCLATYEHDHAVEHFEWRIGDNSSMLTSYGISADVLSR